MSPSPQRRRGQTTAAHPLHPPERSIRDEPFYWSRRFVNWTTSFDICVDALSIFSRAAGLLECQRFVSLKPRGPLRFSSGFKQGDLLIRDLDDAVFAAAEPWQGTLAGPFREIPMFWKGRRLQSCGDWSIVPSGLRRCVIPHHQTAPRRPTASAARAREHLREIYSVYVEGRHRRPHQPAAEVAAPIFRAVGSLNSPINYRSRPNRLQLERVCYSARERISNSASWLSHIRLSAAHRNRSRLNRPECSRSRAKRASAPHEPPELFA